MIKNLINIIASIFYLILSVGMIIIQGSNLNIELDNTLDNGWLICIWGSIALLLTVVIRFLWCNVRPEGRRNRRRRELYLNKPKRNYWPFMWTLMFIFLPSSIIVEAVNYGFASDNEIVKPFIIVSFEKRSTVYRGGGRDYHEIHVTDGLVEAIVFAKKDAVAADYMSGRVNVSIRRGGWGFNIYKLSENWKIEHSKNSIGLQFF